MIPNSFDEPPATTTPQFTALAEEEACPRVKGMVFLRIHVSVDTFHSKLSFTFPVCSFSPTWPAKNS